LSRINEDTVAALDLREGLLVDLSSEHFKSAGYVDLVENVVANEASFPDLKTDSGYVYRKAEHLAGDTQRISARNPLASARYPFVVTLWHTQNDCESEAILFLAWPCVGYKDLYKCL